MMKKIMSVAVLILLAQFSFGKKVKFSVNMTGQTVSALGVHVMGDFQALAGLGADFTPDGALMIKDLADTNIYYLYTDIPAFAKYEYKYVNGDQSYEVEVIPDKAQVGYNFVDNRWIYIDSLANDTTVLPTFVFGQTSPAGMTMMRYIVDMTLQTVSPNGVHIAGSFQGWNPASTRLYSFGSNAYEIIVYGTAGNSYEYKFYNGNTAAMSETVPGACAVNGNRGLTLTMDTIPAKVCFATCTTCYPLSASTVNSKSGLKVYPNPMSEYANIDFNDNSLYHDITITDILGRRIVGFNHVTDRIFKLESNVLNKGVYILSVTDDMGEKSASKLSVD